MGQGFSSSNNANKTPASTPQRAPSGACLDPRSPSQDIERTPIQFNENSGTDSVRLKNEGNAGSSESSESSSAKEAKPRKPSLRQRMFERKKNNETPSENSEN
uniref:Uncharacterized protein n=1 Tax=Caenorhabditis tropicalis TaxID=1561998 RepID=A0A1I7UHF9_9PELO